MAENNVTLEEIAETLKSGDSFLLLCHRHPDGDTLGSALALKRSLEYLGKKADVACADYPAANNEFLFYDNEELLYDAGDDCSAVIAVDVAEKSLLGDLGEIYGDKVDIKIDHHETGEDYAKRNYTDAQAAACGEIIYRLTVMLGIPADVIAEPIYAAISSDTGGFRYSNTTSATHRIAAEMLEAGADNTFIDHMLYENRTQGEIRALTAAYSSMRYYLDGKVAVVTITNEDKQRMNLREEDMGGISSITREIAGVVVGITLRQDKKDYSKFRMSVRSEPGFPANELCAMFGGGGHPCAAGAEVAAPNGKTAVAVVLKHLADDGEYGVKLV